MRHIKVVYGYIIEPKSRNIKELTQELFNRLGRNFDYSYLEEQRGIVRRGDNNYFLDISSDGREVEIRYYNPRVNLRSVGKDIEEIEAILKDVFEG